MLRIVLLVTLALAFAPASATPLVSECAAGMSWSYNSSTTTASCVPSAATQKSALLIECGAGLMWAFSASQNKMTCTTPAQAKAILSDRKPIARGPVPKK
jgi:hypothetical protein